MPCILRNDHLCSVTFRHRCFVGSKLTNDTKTRALNRIRAQRIHRWNRIRTLRRRRHGVIVIDFCRKIVKLPPTWISPSRCDWSLSSCRDHKRQSSLQDHKLVDDHLQGVQCLSTPMHAAIHLLLSIGHGRYSGGWPGSFAMLHGRYSAAETPTPASTSNL